MSSPFDPSGFGALLGGFQQKVQEVKDRVAATHYDGEAGGGLVKVTVTGENVVVAVAISEEAYEDRELLEDLVRAASNEALRKAKEGMANELKALTGGLGLPPGMIPGL